LVILNAPYLNSGAPKEPNQSTLEKAAWCAGHVELIWPNSLNLWKPPCTANVRLYQGELLGPNWFRKHQPDILMSSRLSH